MALVITLILAGAVLILLETILPGLIAGIAGLFCLGAAVVLGYSNYGAATGTWILLGVAALLLLGTLLWLRFFPQSRLGQRFVLQRNIDGVATQAPALLHQTGTAFTILRPSGTALIAGRRVDVVTEGSLVDCGTAIKVVAIEGMRIVVRAL